MAAEESARCLVVMTTCPDPVIHRSRVEGRQRQIPNWYELDWDHVERSRASWVPPGDVDLVLQATDGLGENAERLRGVIAAFS